MSLTGNQRTALTGLALSMPFAALIFVYVSGIQPLEGWLTAATTDTGGSVNLLGKILMGGSLLLLPVALVTSLWPVVRGHRPLLSVNLAVALGVAALMAPVLYGLGDEYVRCEVQRIPNCD